MDILYISCDLNNLFSLFMGFHFVGVCVILALGLLAVGLDVPLFCYTDPLPDIDRCHSVYSVVRNIEMIN